MNMRLGILLSLLVVTGCANIAKWIPSDFDNVEFDRLAELHVLASAPMDGKNWCGSYDIGMINYHASVLTVYSENRLNDNITLIYQNINSISQTLLDRVRQPGSPPSEARCKLSRGQIADLTDEALEVFGDRK